MPTEALYMGAMITSALMTAKLLELIEDLSAERAQHERNIRAITYFMRSRKIPSDLQSRVKLYMEYTFGLKKQAKVDSIIHSLSHFLRSELQGCLMRESLVLYPFFLLFPVDRLDMISTQLDVVLFSISEDIWAAGSDPECMLTA